ALSPPPAVALLAALAQTARLTRRPGRDPLPDVVPELGVRREVARTGLGDEPPHVAVLKVQQEEQPPGLAHAGQRGPRQEDSRTIRRFPRHALVPELVLVYPALPHPARERMTRLVPGRQPPHTQGAPAHEQPAQAGGGDQLAQQ